MGASEMNRALLLLHALSKMAFSKINLKKIISLLRSLSITGFSKINI